MPSNAVTALDAVDIAIDGYPLLRDLTMTLSPGRLVVVGGPAGCGKSSLLQVFTGNIRPDTGTVTANGRDLTRASARRWATWRREIGVLSREFSLADEWTAAENVAAALHCKGGISRAAIEYRTNHELRKWGLLSRRHLHTAALSTSERTRLQLARAFVRRPAAVFLDEPLAGLPTPNRAELKAAIKAEAIAGAAVLVAAADYEGWQADADEIYLISESQLHRPQETPALIAVSGMAG